MRNLLLSVGTVVLASIAAAQSSPLQLTVESHPDPTNSLPKSRRYVTIAKNISNQRVYLPAAKLAGGYVGEGTFFPCVVEVKNRGIWTAVHRVLLQNVSGERGPIYVQLDPGENIEVCTALLPARGGRSGALARFVLLRDWNLDAPRWVLSNEFKVD
jgi:hypothetical protein